MQFEIANEFALDVLLLLGLEIVRLGVGRLGLGFLLDGVAFDFDDVVAGAGGGGGAGVARCRRRSRLVLGVVRLLFDLDATRVLRLPFFLEHKTENEIKIRLAPPNMGSAFVA